MAASSNDPTTGAPVFLDADAPDPAVNPSQVATFAAAVGTRLIGTTAERTAYAYAREGLGWFDTDTGIAYEHNGSGWVRAGDGGDQAVPLTNSGGTTFINQTFTLTVSLRSGIVALRGRVSRSAGSGSIVGVIPTGFRPPTNVHYMAFSIGGGGVLSAAFLVDISASTGEITLAPVTAGPAWDSNVWIVLNTAYAI